MAVNWPRVTLVDVDSTRLDWGLFHDHIFAPSSGLRSRISTRLVDADVFFCVLVEI